MTVENDDVAARERARGATRRVVLSAIAALVLAAVVLVAAGEAAASTVSGKLKRGKGYQVVLVQANGRAKTAHITKASGAFKLTTGRLARSTLHLVRADGSYFGPVVLKAKGNSAYCTIKGRASLKLGTLALKSGYARDVKVNCGRFDTRKPYTARAKRGKPIGAGVAGLVRTGTPKGYRGEGGDLDRDGVVGAFDIDDNGNLILDNVDRTWRGERRPPAMVAARAGVRGDDPPPPPGPQQFGMFSNFRQGGGRDQEACINASIPGIEDVEGLVNTYLPRQLLLVIPVVGDRGDGSTATLDGLGNVWIAEHQVDGLTYPQTELAWPDRVPATHSKGPGLLDLVAGHDRRGDAFIFPGARADQITSGDAFVERAADGKQYAGVLNFAFNTVPALKSYHCGDGPEAVVTYGADGVPDVLYLPLPRGETSITITCWRPQRKAAPGETGSFVGDWVDIGRLAWEAPPCGTGYDPDGEELPGTTQEEGIFLAAGANTVVGSTPITIEPDAPSVLDPAADAATDGDNTISITLDLARMYSNWNDYPAGSQVEFDLGARAAFGDLASTRVMLELR